jgi:uncharacterized membrane protein YraQ (UPF0718 family)
MKMMVEAVKKRTAFWVALVNVNVVFIIAALFHVDAAILLPVITGVLGLTDIYTGFNVADNWQRSKCFTKELQ